MGKTHKVEWYAVVGSKTFLHRKVLDDNGKVLKFEVVGLLEYYEEQDRKAQLLGSPLYLKPPKFKKGLH